MRAFGPRVWLVSCAALLVLAPNASAYEVETHEAISDTAARNSSVEGVLRNVLGLQKGLDEVVDNRPVVQWIRGGSRLEDEGGFLAFRYINHFHNPLLPWDAAGLRWLPPNLGPQSGRSSILWGQDQTQEWSWPRVRQYYFDALTKPARTEREQNLGRTFRGLGQLIHLVQDAATPAHTRNDPHSAYSYESLVRDVQREEPATVAGLLASTQGPDAGWQTLAPNSLAPVPIARLLDTDRYDATNPGITTESLMGLAEYTNANFFSEDRQFPDRALPFPRFPYPARSSVGVVDSDVKLRTGEVVPRQYYQKVADGDTGYRLATVGFLRDYIQRFNLDSNRLDRPGLDESVYRDYAAKLLPRAVGYSTALLDYFFRGKLDVALVADPNDGTGSRFSLRGTNASTEPLSKGGTITLYADDANGARSLANSFTLVEPVPPNGTIQSASFIPPLNTARFVAVYRGTLGQEPDAVIGKVLSGGKAEELYIAATATGGLDVWFRNATQNRALGVGSDPHLKGLEPLGVAWSADGVWFTVWVAGYRYHVYRLNREPNTPYPDGAIPVALWDRMEEPFNDRVALDVSAWIAVTGHQYWYEATATEYNAHDYDPPLVTYTITPHVEELGLSGGGSRSYTMRDLFPTAPDPFAPPRSDVQGVLVRTYGAGQDYITTTISDTWLDAQGRLRLTLTLEVDMDFRASSGLGGVKVICGGGTLETVPQNTLARGIRVLDTHVGVWAPEAGWLWRSFRLPATVGFHEGLEIISTQTFPDDPGGANPADYPGTWNGSYPVFENGGDPIADALYSGLVYTPVCGQWPDLLESPANEGDWQRMPDLALDDVGEVSTDHESNGQGFLHDPDQLAYVTQGLAAQGIGTWWPQEWIDIGGDSSYEYVFRRHSFGVHVTRSPFRYWNVQTNYTDGMQLRLLHWDPDPAQARYWAAARLIPDFIGDQPSDAFFVDWLPGVIDGNGRLVRIVQPFAPDPSNTGGNASVDIPREPTLLSGSARHVLWARQLQQSRSGYAREQDVVLLDAAGGASNVVLSVPYGPEAADLAKLPEFTAHALRVMEPDQLYAWAPGEQTFVRGWDAGGSPTLSQSQPGYPVAIPAPNAGLQPPVPDQIRDLRAEIVGEDDSTFHFTPGPSYYSLVAESSQGSLHASEVVGVAFPPASSTVKLTWTNPSPDLTAIRVYRSAQPWAFPPSTLIATLSGGATQYVDDGAAMVAPPTDFQAGSRLPARRLVP